MKKAGIIIIFFLFSLNNYAQNSTAHSYSYRTSAGVKLWDGIGISLKTFINSRSAIEFNGFFNGDGSHISGLYEFHGNLNTENNLKWYAGPGAHIRLDRNTTYAGLDGVVGVDYKFRNLPLNICLDWQPYFDFVSDGIVRPNHGGVGARYTF
jgi:hypothetical protein